MLTQASNEVYVLDVLVVVGVSGSQIRQSPVLVSWQSCFKPVRIEIGTHASV